MEDGMGWTWSQEEMADLSTWAWKCEYVPESFSVAVQAALLR